MFDVLKNSTEFSNARYRRAIASARRPNASAHAFELVHLRFATGRTLERTPNFLKRTALAKRIFLFQYRVSVFGSVAPPRNGWRGRPARERGLNENTLMVLVLARLRKSPIDPLLHRRTGTRVREALHFRRHFPRPLQCLPVHGRNFFGIQMQVFTQAGRCLPLSTVVREHQLVDRP